MKIVTLIENTACREGLAQEHGLSLYIETGGHRILFDAGQTDAFADNAQLLGIDLRRVDFAVLSHGHYDHGGGLKRFLELNDTAPIYLHRDAFMPHFNAAEKDIGLNPDLQNCGRLVFTDGSVSITPDITLHDCNSRSRPCPADSYGLTLRENGRLLPEDFRHEQYLLIEEAGKTFCFSGCSHKGILNIVTWFQPDVLVGGFHFMKLDPQGSGRQALTRAARQLLDSPTVYYTGHCTGQAQYQLMEPLMQNRLCSLSTGTVIEL